MNINPFIVYFYVVSEQPLSDYKFGGLYTLNSGVFGDFQVAVATSGSGYPDGGVNISVNGAPPESNTPVLSPGSSSSDPTIIYGDPSDQVMFFLTIKDQQIISLAQAKGNSKAKVATAEMDIINGASGVEYAVDVIFTNLANTNPFELVWQGGGSTPPSIPYYLFFNEHPVTPGNSVPWSGLVNGPQSKNIFVTGVDEDDIQQALSGHYEDTIVVNIVPVD